MAFNDTLGANITNAGELAIAVNQSSDNWMSVGILLTFYIAFIMINHEKDIPSVLLADAMIVLIVALILWKGTYMSFANVEIFIGIFVLSLIYYIYDKS